MQRKERGEAWGWYNTREAITRVSRGAEVRHREKHPALSPNMHRKEHKRGARREGGRERQTGVQQDDKARPQQLPPPSPGAPFKRLCFLEFPCFFTPPPPPPLLRRMEGGSPVTGSKMGRGVASGIPRSTKARKASTAEAEKECRSEGALAPPPPPPPPLLPLFMPCSLSPPPSPPPQLPPPTPGGGEKSVLFKLVSHWSTASVGEVREEKLGWRCCCCCCCP